MGFKKIYLVRHGSIKVDNEQKSFIGQIDLPLSDEGLEQVSRLGEMLRKIKITSVYCSDLERSIVTAGVISAYHNVDPTVRSELREISLGDWEGLTFAEVINRYPAEFKQRGADIVNFSPHNGESFYDCSKRVIKAFEDIIMESTGNTVIAGHAGVNRLIICHVLGMPIENLFNISQDYGCLNIIFTGKSHSRLMLMNDTGNL